MNTAQGLVLILLATVVVIWWERAASQREAAAGDRPSAPSSRDDALDLPSQHTRRRDDAWLAQVNAWGDDLDGRADVRRQVDAMSRAEVYATVSADKAAQIARVGDAA